MDVDGEANAAPEKKALKGISDSLVLLHSLRQSRQKWLSNPPFVRFSTRPRVKGVVEILQPPHTLTLLGRCDVEVGPHIFVDTKIIEVTYENQFLDGAGDATMNDASAEASTSTEAQVQQPDAILSTDILIEFREAPSERFLLPLDCSIIERVLRLGVPPTILLSTVIASPSESNLPPTPLEQIPQHPLTIHFVHAGTPIWEAMQKRVMTSKMPIQTVQLVLDKAVKAPVSRAYIPLRLPEGDLLKNIAESLQASDKYEMKPLVLKELRDASTFKPPKLVSAQTTSGSSIVKRKRPSVSTSHPNKRVVIDDSPTHTNVNRFGRKTTSINLALAGEGRGQSLEREIEEEAARKPSEKRVKLPCSECGKTIARKVDDTEKEDYKPICRNCATDQRKARDLAHAEAMAKAQALNPRPTKPVPNPNLMRPMVHIPYRPTIPWPGPIPASGIGSLPSSATSSPNAFNLFSPRPPPAPSHMTTPGLGRGSPSAASGAGAGRGRGVGRGLPPPTYYQPAGVIGGAKPSMPIYNPYASLTYSYRPLPPPVPGTAGVGRGTAAGTAASASSTPGAGSSTGTAAGGASTSAKPSTIPAAHPYTGRYYNPTSGAYTWRPSLYPTGPNAYLPVTNATTPPTANTGAGRGLGRGGLIPVIPARPGVAGRGAGTAAGSGSGTGSGAAAAPMPGLGRGRGIPVVEITAPPKRTPPGGSAAASTKGSSAAAAAASRSTSKPPGPTASSTNSDKK